MRFAVLLAALMAVAPLSAMAADSALSPAANAAFLAANAKKPGVVTTNNGLQYRVIQNGYGKRPGQSDLVTVYYKGSLINGKVFDSTEQGLPATFTVNKLIPGWTEALQLMREGDHWELVIPSELAYGTRGAGDGLIPPNQVLVFDLQLVSVATPPKKQGDDDSSGGSGQQ
ncbi:MAG TPA: FKBP-type peptidyl-prolyl cis-trans isomerase [Rhizomicrobium sp.]|nr:FKBP-type peptidyl-prolyl cis-trans isomerase [Rhizomicrobium sp.]